MYLKFEESAGGKREYPGRIKSIEDGNLQVGFADGTYSGSPEPRHTHALSHTTTACLAKAPRAAKPRESHSRCCCNRTGQSGYAMPSRPLPTTPLAALPLTDEIGFALAALFAGVWWLRTRAA